MDIKSGSLRSGREPFVGVPEIRSTPVSAGFPAATFDSSEVTVVCRSGHRSRLGSPRSGWVRTGPSFSGMKYPHLAQRGVANDLCSCDRPGGERWRSEEHTSEL